MKSINIADWRAKRKLSQADLAELLPINKRTLQQWEQGRGAPPVFFERALRDLDRQLRSKA
jgi:DNA-binding transcriptional regulator YiaG